MRLALGARRLRLVRQLLTEALLISIIGGAVGLWGSVMLLEWLSGWQPFPEFPMNVPVTPDNHVYAIALLLAIASGFLFGAATIRPVLAADPYGIVKSGSRSTPERRITVRDLLLGVQIAICAVLVTSSMVAVRGMLRSLDSHLGIDPRSAMLVRIDPTLAGYKGDKVPEMQQRMIDVVKQIPGVTSVGLVGEYPPLHVGWSNTDVFTERTTDLRAANAAADAMVYEVSTGYLQAAGTTLLSGRAFTVHDDQNSPRVAIVNREFVRKVFGSATGPIGGSLQDEGWNPHTGGGYRRGREVHGEPRRRSEGGDVPADPAIAFERCMDGGALEARSAATGGSCTGAIAEPGCGAAGLRANVGSGNERSSFCSSRGRAVPGRAGPDGRRPVTYRDFRNGCLFREPAEAGIGHTNRPRRGTQRDPPNRIGPGGQATRFRFGGRINFGISGQPCAICHRISGNASRSSVLAGVVLAMALLGLAATWIPAQRTLSLDPMNLLREE